MTGLADLPAIHDLLRREGYVHVPGLVEPSLLDELAQGLAERLLGPGDSHLDRLRAWRPSETEIGRMREAGYSIEAFHRLAHHPGLIELMEGLLGGAVLVHPRRFLRMAVPGDDVFASPPHQDYRYVQGSLDTLTAWIALHSVPVTGSTLRMLPGSHRSALHAISAQTDGTLPYPAEIASDDARWRTVPVQAGDVIVFHSLTLHTTLPPADEAGRLSVDVRFQRRDEPFAVTALRAPYENDTPDDPRVWSNDPWLDLPDDLPVLEKQDFDEVVLPAIPSRFLETTS